MILNSKIKNIASYFCHGLKFVFKLSKTLMYSWRLKKMKCEKTFTITSLLVFLFLVNYCLCSGPCSLINASLRAGTADMQL